MSVHIVLPKTVGELATKVKVCSPRSSLESLLGKFSETPVMLVKGGGLVRARDVLGALVEPGFAKKQVKDLALEGLVLDSGMDAMEALGYLQKTPESYHVVLEGKNVKGLLSEMDFVKRLRKGPGIRVGDVMSHKAIVLRKDWSLKEAAGILARGAFPRMPVSEKGVLLGALSTGSLLEYIKTSGENLRKSKALVKDVMFKPKSIGLGKSILDFVKIGEPWMPVEKGSELVGIVTKRDILDVLGS